MKFLDAHVGIAPVCHPVVSRRRSRMDQENSREHCGARRHLEEMRFASVFLLVPPLTASFLPVHRNVPGEHSFRRRDLFVRVRIAAGIVARIIPFENSFPYPTGSQTVESLQTKLGICPHQPSLIEMAGEIVSRLTGRGFFVAKSRPAEEPVNV